MAYKLTKNFSLDEFTQSPTAKQYFIDNTPNSEVITNITKLVSKVLQPVRDEFGEPIVVSSGYRCDKLNTKVGGALKSDHKYGCAADIHTKSDKPSDNKRLFDLICKMAKDGDIQCRQIIDEYHYNWVHVSINNKYNSKKDNQILHLA